MTELAAQDHWYGPVLVIGAANGGRYPDGNAMVVDGADTRLLLDTSLTVHERGGVPLAVDAVVLSHVHEDHIPALHLFAHLDVHVHRADALALASMSGLLTAYGYHDMEAEWAAELERDFHVSFRPDATVYDDGHTWDLGGGRTVTAVYLPGHTPGHCGLLVEPEGFFYVADIDLTGFGPFYGDATSSLVSFETSLARCMEIDARWYGTFHHKGVILGREAFRRELDAFSSVIRRRDAEILTFLAEPHTVEEMAEHRFLYRPHIDLPFVVYAERRTAGLHIDKLLGTGMVVEVEDGRYRAAT